MTDLGTYLERLGLEQYLDAFLGEGYDFYSLLDIQESDFDALNVKLGHRRKLQRAIAEYRGIPFERLVAGSSYEASPEGNRGSDVTPTTSAGSLSGTSGAAETKRKYRRHPKPDEHAPERPPSAYVIFSNKIRDEVKNQNLTFTQIAKLVGERWQKLDPEGKEPFEANANAAKERYNIQLSTYKKTDAYKEYLQYLADFKAKHGGASEQKRPRLEQESSGSIISTKSAELQPEMLMPGQGGHFRKDSTGSMGSATYATVTPSPVAHVGPTLPSQIPPAYSQRAVVASSYSESPTSTQPVRELQRRGQLSNQSSVSDESSIIRSDSDTLPQTASLSLNTPPSVTPPLSALQASGTHDQSAGHDGFRRFQSSTPQAAIPSFVSQAAGGTNFGNPFGQTLPSPATPESSWRTRPLDLRGYTEPSRAMHPPPLLTSGPASSTISLPPLIGSDRLSDSQRTLPPPRSSPISQQPPGLPQGIRSYHFGSTPRPQQALERMHSPPDRESDAADALAGLAAGGPRSDSAKPPHP